MIFADVRSFSASRAFHLMVNLSQLKESFSLMSSSEQVKETKTTQASQASQTSQAQPKKRKGRDLSVEAIRIIAAFFVISLHSMLPSVVDGEVLPYRVFYNMVIGDAVAIFWMVSGFFMFGEMKYTKMLKKAVTKNIIPTVAILLVTFLCMDFIRGAAPTLSESMDKTPEQWQGVINMLLYWTTVPPVGKPPLGVSILWFMMVYAVIMLIWPVLNAFVLKYLKGNNKNQLVFFIITFFLLACNELSNNKILDFSLNTVNALIPSVIFVLWGYIVYQHQDIFATRKWTGFAALGVFIALAFIRTFLGVPAMEASETHSTLIAWWHTPWGMIGATSIIIACFSFFPQSSDKAYAKAIGAVGGATMMIYLTHIMVQHLLLGRFHNMPEQFFYPGGETLLESASLAYFGYMLVTAGEIFVIALVVSLLWGWLMKFVKFIGRKLFVRKPKELGNGLGSGSA